MAEARATRRTVLAMASRRQRRGYGSLLSKLEDGVIAEGWWSEVEAALTSVPHVVIGGVAVNAYSAPRHTKDLDVGVLPGDIERAEAALEAAEWRRAASVRPTDPHLAGSAWSGPNGQQVDLFAMRHVWAAQALRETRSDPRTGLPTLPLAYVVLMKMTVSRTTDLADLTRMLGGRSEKELDVVREAVRRFGGPDDIADLEQLIALGRLERDDRD
jgi:hypothetical protein